MLERLVSRLRQFPAYPTSHDIQGSEVSIGLDGLGIEAMIFQMPAKEPLKAKHRGFS